MFGISVSLYVHTYGCSVYSSEGVSIIEVCGCDYNFTDVWVCLYRRPLYVSRRSLGRSTDSIRHEGSRVGKGTSR